MSVHVSDHYYDPDKNYCGLYIVSKLALPEFGPTSELIKIFDKREIILLSITSHQKDGLVYDFIIVDLTGKESVKTELEKEIREKFGDKLVFIECADTGVPGFIYNVNGFPLVFNFSNNYTQVAALTAPIWKTLIMGMIKRFGASASIILWYMGNDAGEGKGKVLLTLTGINNRDMIKIGLARLQSLGWGRFELAECDEQGKEVVIRVYDNFEEMVTKELLDYQNSFMKGFLVGLASTIFGKGCRAIETKCVNKGDPYCEFVLR
jgi:predicted hydrocarbon binding protein